jgi:hypothetical protein
MADKTLIQGAQNIANARNTSGIGQAFGVGLDASIARQKEARATKAEQDRKKAEAIQKRTEKYLNEWDGTNINNGELSEGQMAEVHKAAKAIQKDFQNVVMNKLSKDPTNIDLINEKNGYKQEMKALRSAVDNYADGFEIWKEGVDRKLYSKSAANIGSLALNEQAYTQPVVWDRESKSLALPNSRGEDGKALLYKNVNLPFTDGNDAAKIISDKAGELSEPRKNNLSDFQIKNNKEEIKSLILASNPAEGVNNTPALLANEKMLSLFPEWKSIEYAATMTDDQKYAVAEEMANVVMSRYKSVAEAAAGITPSGDDRSTNVIRSQYVNTVNRMQALEKEILSAGPSARPPADITETFKFGDKSNPDQIKVKWDTKENKWKYLNSKSMVKAFYNTLEDLMVTNPTIFYK